MGADPGPLLDLGGATWRTGSWFFSKLSRWRFLDEITLCSLAVNCIGNITLHFEVGGLFEGHLIEARIVDDGIRAPSLAG